ncbi:MAG TPA: SRPBCC family protein [Phycisphaerae bacterium]
MSRLSSLIRGLGLGAGLMYFFDPHAGRRRRKLVRDKLVRAVHETSNALDKASRDLLNRAHGLLAEGRALACGAEAEDDVIAERVRAKLGLLCSHPGAIEVHVENGRAVLSGPILTNEVQCVIDGLRRVRGVRSVENRLEPHEQAGDVPGLQGGASRRRGRPRFELMQVNWSPAARVLVGATGLRLLLGGRSRKSGSNPQRGSHAALGAVGLGLVARALTNKPLKRLLGVNGGRRAIDIQKTINVAAPVERVFEFWSSYDNFPRFMAHVREVRSFDGRSHWTVSGPAGIPIEFDTVLTRFVPYQSLAWKSVPGSPIRHAGVVNFQANPDGGTRVDIKMSYNPPAGALGHAIATLFGSDPKRAMDEDLVRFKSLIEQGHTRAHGERVTREEIEEAVHGPPAVGSAQGVVPPIAPLPPL